MLESHVRPSDEYEKFKEFVKSLRREINEDDSKKGLCENNSNFAFGFEIIQEVAGLVTAINSDNICNMQKELFKITCSAYKMWRNLN